MTTIFLVCDIDDTSHTIRALRDPEAVKIVLTRSAMFRLLGEDISFISTSDVVPANKVRILGDQAADVLDNAISLAEKTKCELPFNPVRPLAYRILQFYCYCVSIVELLESIWISTEESVDSIRIVGSNRLVDTAFGFANLLDLIVSSWCLQKDVDFVRLQGGPDNDDVVQASNVVKDVTGFVTRYVALLLQSVYILRRCLRGMRPLFAMLNPFNPQPVCFYDAPYWDLKVLSNHSARGLGVTWINFTWLLPILRLTIPMKLIAAQYRVQLENWWRDHASEVNLVELFSYRGLNLAQAVHQYAISLVSQDEGLGLISYLHVRRILSRITKAQGFIILGRGSDSVCTWISEAVTNERVFSVGMSHGFMSAVHSPRHRIHFRDLDVMAHYGPLCRLPDDMTACQVSVGSATLGEYDQVSTNVTSKADKIDKLLWCWHGARELLVDPWIMSWDRLIRPRLEILELLAGSQYDVTIRPFPGLDDPIVDYAQERYPNLHFEKQTRFSAIMPTVDVLIVEFPSTPLIEALCTSKPILYFAIADIFDYHPGALRLLRRRCTVFDTADDYVEGIRNFIASPEPYINSMDLRDTSFQQAYAQPVSVEDFSQGLARIVLDNNVGFYSHNDSMTCSQ